VRIHVQIRHRVGGECDVEAILISLARGRFDTNTGGNARKYDLRNTEGAKMLFKSRLRKRSGRCTS
jgi:hypothetical protein